MQSNQLCINTAIVYMHRFYVIHSFKTFHRHLVATSSVFLAAKSEEQPRKLQYVAQASYACVHKDKPMLDIQSEEYTKLVEEITYYELVLLETLGFEVKVDHPHPHVVKCMQFLKASKDLAQMAYFMAHNSLLLTTFCLEHSPSTVACVCIHLSCRWKGLDIPRSSDGKSWWEYIDPSINRIKLDELTKEFLMIYDKSPSRLQKKITEPIKMQGSSGASSSSTSGRSLAVLHSSEKGKHPSGAHGHMAKQQHQRPNPPPQPGSHGMKPHTQSTGDRDLKNHGRGPHAPHPQPQSSRGVKRHHTEAQSQGKKRVKTEHSNSQPPLPPAPSLPPLPPLPSGPPPPPNSISTLLSSHPPPPQHHHHRPHSKHRANSLAPPLPPPLPLSPSPPPPPPPR